MKQELKQANILVNITIIDNYNVPLYYCTTMYKTPKQYQQHNH